MAGLVVIEGANSVGKTYLADRMRRRFPDAVYVHCVYRFKQKIWAYHLAALQHALKHSQHKLCILDRQWLSEDIYAGVYRGGTLWPHEGRLMQKLLLKHAALTVLCTTDIEHNMALIAKYRQAYHSPELLTNAGLVAEKYANVWTGASLECRQTYADDLTAAGGAQHRHDWLKYDVQTDGQDVAGFIDKILGRLGQLRAVQYQEALSFNCRNVAGYLPTAKYLLVGAKVNHPKYEKCWPFMAYKNSSLFTAKAMHELGCKEEEFMWTNANCPENHVEKLLLEKPSLVPVAMGQDAIDLLHKIGISNPYGVPHPSYGRRFMAGFAWQEALRFTLSRTHV